MIDRRRSGDDDQPTKRTRMIRNTTREAARDRRLRHEGERKRGGKDRPSQDER